MSKALREFGLRFPFLERSAVVAQHANPEGPVRFGAPDMRRFLCHDYAQMKEESAAAGRILVRRAAEEEDDAVSYTMESAAFRGAGEAGAQVAAWKTLATSTMYQEAGGGVRGTCQSGLLALSEAGTEGLGHGVRTRLQQRSDGVVEVVTPDDAATKVYVTGAADATMRHAVVSGDLVDEDGESLGPHYVVVRVREDDGTLAEGVDLRVQEDGSDGMQFASLAFCGVAAATVPRPAHEVTFARAKLASAALSLGECKAGLLALLDDAAQSKAVKMPQHQIRIAEFVAKTIALACMVQRASRDNTEGLPLDERASLAKVAASELSWEISSFRSRVQPRAALARHSFQNVEWPCENAALRRALSKYYVDSCAPVCDASVSSSTLASPAFSWLFTWVALLQNKSDPTSKSLLKELIQRHVRSQGLVATQQIRKVLLHEAELGVSSLEVWRDGMGADLDELARDYVDMQLFLNLFIDLAHSTDNAIKPTLDAWLTLLGMHLVKKNMAYHAPNMIQPSTFHRQLKLEIAEHTTDLMQDARALVQAL
eukprot:Rhum_TRINITY_DN19442_c0_g1::Rhum_TRINITY_DN19442_c0_g1_i1::g.170004::m.170004